MRISLIAALLFACSAEAQLAQSSAASKNAQAAQNAVATTSAQAARSAIAQTILLVDIAKVEASSLVVQRLRAEALTSLQKKTPNAKTLTAEYVDALDLSLSDFRGALPAVIAALAKAEKADAVLEPLVAKKFGLSGVDVSNEVQKRIDAQFSKSKFMPP